MTPRTSRCPLRHRYGLPASFDVAAGAYAYRNLTETYIFNGCTVQGSNESLPYLSCAVTATVDSTGCRCFNHANSFYIPALTLFAAHNNSWDWSPDGTTGCWQADFPDGNGYTDMAYVCLDSNGVPSLAAAEDVGWYNNTLDGTRLAKPNRSLLPLSVPPSCCP